MLAPLIDESTVLSAIEDFEKLRANLEVDIHTLHEGMKLLSKTARSFVKEIRGKIRAVREEFEEVIRKEAVARKVGQINEEYNDQRIKLINSFEKQLLPLQREKVKLEKTRGKLSEKLSSTI
ncbi:hypothetical protein, partial [Escherichia coli]|uniref:hypothetical protein n=1 Tax=Escherichia coli TaxID=562 RepID=UPI00128EF1DA